MTAIVEFAPIFAFDNSYARLPERFFKHVAPTAVPAPKLIRLNDALARHLKLDPEALISPEGVAVLAGNRIDPSSEPLAMAYAGHQFGSFSPQLGDGRALLLGEVIDRDGVRRDIQLKGSGPTPFSRRGDGRAALGPVLREYILSEAFAALGVPSTRALAAVATGEYVYRDPPAPGAVLTRVAASHVRIGTFQFFAARSDIDAVKVLADYVIARHYPGARSADNSYRALLDHVIAAQASLIAKWMHFGFIHGVMNTDNMSIAGETIDFGPCAFIDDYHPGTVFSSIDEQGRYAYANQPRIALWNLTRLAETLIPLLAEEKDAALASAQEALGGFAGAYEKAYAEGFARKLGLMTSRPDDVALGLDLLDRMAANGADFTLTFRKLCDAALSQEADAGILQGFKDPSGFDDWAVRWRQRLADEAVDNHERAQVMRLANPAFIPRNHLVEEVIVAAVDRGDYEPFATLIEVLARPFEDQPGFARCAMPPTPSQVVHQTFCGT